MLEFLQRTEKESATIKLLWQACNIGRGAPTFDPDTHLVLTYGSCDFCRYKSSVHNMNEWVTCTEKHSCKLSLYPFIAMGRPINRELSLEYDNPDGTLLYYESTGIYRQVKINAQPLYVQLFLCQDGQARCNSSCWYHGWRLDKKTTWRQCGYLHLCHNDGSLWFLMAPTNEELYKEFLAGSPASPQLPDFNDDFNNDFLIE